MQEHIQNKIWNSLDDECKEYIMKLYTHVHKKRMYEAQETVDRIFGYENINMPVDDSIKVGDKAKTLVGSIKDRIGVITEIDTYSVVIEFMEGDSVCISSSDFEIINDQK